MLRAAFCAAKPSVYGQARLWPCSRKALAGGQFAVPSLLPTVRLNPTSIPQLKTRSGSAAPLYVSARSLHAIARGMRGCSRQDLRRARPALHGVRGMAYQKGGLNKVPGWMVNLVVGVVGVGALAMLFTVGLGAIALAAVAISAWLMHSTVVPAVRAFMGTRGTGSGDLVASLRRARSGAGGGSRMSGVLRLMRDSVVLSVGSTLLMGQYASFTLGEVAESVLNQHGAFSRRYGPVMVVVQGEPENDFVHIKGTDGSIVDKLPSLVLNGIAIDGRGKPVGQVRLVATYDSLDVQERRTWGEWAQGKKQSMSQLLAAIKGGGSSAPASTSASAEDEPDFSPEFMRKLKDAVLDMPEFEFTLREMRFTVGELDPVTKAWQSAGGEDVMELTEQVSGLVKRAVDHIPGEHVVHSAMTYMGGSDSGQDADVRAGLQDIYRSFVARRHAAYRRAEAEKRGEDPSDSGDDGEAYTGSAQRARSGGRRSRASAGGGGASFTRASSHGGSSSSSGTVLDAEFTVRKDSVDAEPR